MHKIVGMDTGSSHLGGAKEAELEQKLGRIKKLKA